MCAARPSGCRLTRYTFSGGSSSVSGSAAVSSVAALLARTTFHNRSTTTPGYGSWASSMRCSEARACTIDGSSNELWLYRGA